ncbi:MAG: ABC transporter substrate-binding protein [Acidobacteriota bacterium]
MPQIRRLWPLWMLCAGLVVGICPAGEQPGDGEAAAARGRQIYGQGTSPSGGSITALMGAARVEVPATVLPCANCHGEDGKGRPEGGVVPTNITWEALTKPYGVRHAGGRQHPPYDVPRLKRAITMGFDPAGEELHLAMPRYRLSAVDLDDLIAYLHRVGEQLDPGLTRDTIRIGTLLPAEGPSAARGAAMEEMLRAYLDGVNERGGIYSRRLELVVGHVAADPGSTADEARAFLARERPFALAGVFLAGADDAVAALADDVGIPVVGGLTVDPARSAVVNRHVFYLNAGLEGEARALVEFASRQAGTSRPRMVILYRQGSPLDHVVSAVQEQARHRGWGDVDAMALAAATFDPTALADRLQAEQTKILVLLAAGRPEGDLLASGARHGWRPTVLIPGSLASQQIFEFPTDVAGSTFLSFPSLPGDQTPAGIREYTELAKKYDLPAAYPSARMAALSSAKILVEGLKRAGSEVSRERLLAALDGLRDFHTGFTPHVSYRPNRHVGTNGAHIVRLDAQRRTFVPIEGWIDLDRGPGS